MKHGPDLEDMGGTKLDSRMGRPRTCRTADSALEPTKGFLDHYIEEIKEQIRGGPPEKKQ